MFIQTEDTPNPNSCKFLPGIDVSPEDPVFFNNIREALAKSTLAANIFNIEGIQAVFFGKNFITVTKSQTADWSLLRPEILMVIMDHIVAGHAIFNQPVNWDHSLEKEHTALDTSTLSSIEQQIKEIIDTRVRPSVAMDGGDIIYQRFQDGIVYLTLHGSCSGCPSASMTLKQGIETMLKHFIPEVQAVEAVEP